MGGCENMKKLLFTLLLAFVLFMPLTVQAKNKVTIYFFRGNTCSHCEEALDYINKHKDEIDEDIEIVTFEVWKNTNNEKLHQVLVQKLEVSSESKNSVPFIVIGDTYQVGMSGTKANFDKILNMARAYIDDEEYKDVVEETLKEENIDVKSLTLSELYSEPNKIVTIIVYSIFGVIVLGIAAMVLFSRK